MGNQYTESADRWNNLLYEIGQQQAQQFSRAPDLYTKILSTTESTIRLIKLVYAALVNHKKIIPIEELSQEEKREIWDFVVEKCYQYTTDKAKLKEIAIVFYTIDHFINEHKI